MVSGYVNIPQEVLDEIAKTKFTIGEPVILSKEAGDKLTILLEENQNKITVGELKMRLAQDESVELSMSVNVIFSIMHGEAKTITEDGGFFIESFLGLTAVIPYSDVSFVLQFFLTSEISAMWSVVLNITGSE